jgi:pectate lyase
VRRTIRLVALLAPLLVAGSACSGSRAAPERVPAFPGAEGFGAATAGGRGGKVIHVTNPDPSGPGSLQEAVSTPGPRVVVFDVSGVIKGDVIITEPFITIAGQTAPGAGITIYGRLLTRYERRDPVHDVIVRHLRVRAQPGLGDQGDCVQFSVVDRAILDHLSLAWAEDETIDIFTHATNVTIQWCSVEESSTRGHPKGRHNYGLIAGSGSHDISIHHNLFAHHARRNPAVGSGPVDFRNNVVYDFRDGFSHEGNFRGQAGFNIIGNYYQRGPSDKDIFPFCFEDDVPYYLRDNYIAGVGLIQDPWQEADKLYGLQYYASHGVKQEKETPVAPVATQPPQQAYRLVLAQAGCFPRDAITKRIVADVLAGTGSWGRKEQPDLLAGLTPTAPPQDTDRDGMPDAWEKTHGLDPKHDDSAKTMPSGYTAIEEYVNAVAERLIQ